MKRRAVPLWLDGRSGQCGAVVHGAVPGFCLGIGSRGRVFHSVWKSALESCARDTQMKQAKWKLSVAREISGASPRSHIRGDNLPHHQTL
jgi:hypothetical protein